MDALQIFNSLEAVLWISIGVVVFVKAGTARPRHRRLGLISAVWFVLFGISDVIEVFTGAWWHPWWLLAWKATCLVALVSCGITHIGYRQRK